MKESQIAPLPPLPDNYFSGEGKALQPPAFQLNATNSGTVQLQSGTTKEPGEAISDNCSYYVADSKASQRDNNDPMKALSAILPRGMKLKRLRSMGEYSQFEVLETAGSSFAVDTKVWTSYSNVAEETSIIDRDLDYLVSAAVPYFYAYNSSEKCAKLEANTKVVAVRSVFHSKHGEMVQVFDETMKKNLGWVQSKIIKRLPKDIADDFAWMQSAGNWGATDEKVSGDALARIQKNRSGINDRTDGNTYSKRMYHPTKNDGRTKYEGYVYSDLSKDVNVEATGATHFEKQVNAALFEELSKEGSFGSINTWDGEIFTWGKGFSATGQLGLVLQELFTMDPEYKTMFNNVGLDLVAGMLCVIDEQGNRLQDLNKTQGMAASQYIKKCAVIQSFFIELAEKKSYRNDVAKAQYKVLMNKAGKCPAYIMNAEKTAYMDSWTDGSVTMIAHLSHWLPSGSWNNVDYSDTKGKMATVAERFIFKAVARSSAVGAQISNGVYVWKSSLPVYDKLAHYGQPKGSSQIAFDKVYPKDSYVKEIEFKGEKSARKAFLKGTDTYLKDVCLLPTNDSGSNFRIVTPAGKSVNDYLVQDPTKK